MTVSPSNTVNVDQMVTLTCVFQTSAAPPVFFNYKNNTPLCALELTNHTGCKNTAQSCATRYDAVCPNTTHFIVQLPVRMTWNKVSIYCKSFFGDNSNYVVFDVKGMYK